MKYVLYIDYKADYTAKSGMSIEYRAMEAKNFKEAIEEADKILDKEILYLIRIMETTGKIEKMDGGWKMQDYKAVMCYRTCGWHMNTAENGEEKHIVTRHYTKMNGKVVDWYELI